MLRKSVKPICHAVEAPVLDRVMSIFPVRRKTRSLSFAAGRHLNCGLAEIPSLVCWYCDQSEAFTARFEPDADQQDGGFCVTFLDIPNIFTQATMSRTRKPMALDALLLSSGT